ncbi:MAG: 16S rRNA (guanine(966)-N(2))-methyltransferase RsmD [Firmicutes bacterium]|nr:16S rRNA (guanine(966)-N(2))-methyltransferase RsmD [Bacillota bacterium]
MRIIAGKKRGKIINAPKGLTTRPTTDRVKEAIFSTLNPFLAGAVVLDAFAGSGGLGLEAISRGAARAVFCESDRSAQNVIRKNIADCGFEEQSKLLCGDTLQLLRRTGGFDIVLLDPPYNRGLIARVEQILLTPDFLNQDSLVMLETSASEPELFLSSRWQLYKSKTYGDTAVYYFGLADYDNDDSENDEAEV